MFVWSLETDSPINTAMPEREYPLQQRLEALVRFSPPGEAGGAFHEFDSRKGPVMGAFRAGRRRSPRTGGVLFPRDSKSSWAVNIRPKNWGNKDKIWLGKLKCMEEAQRIADIIYFYLGSEPAHFLFPDAGELPPPFLNGDLQLLDSVEKRTRYVKHIAKGDEFQFLRKQLIVAVKEMVKYLTARRDEIDVDFHTDPCNVMDRPSALTGPIRSAWKTRSTSELDVDTFDEPYGRRGLIESFPGLSQDEIDSMMNILLLDYNAL